MPIFLIGMPASGKSAVGRSLAYKLKLPFLDLDKKIEKQAGIDIATMFWAKGEDFFRVWERSTLQEISKIDAVISTGGGTPCFFDNMQWILDHGTSFFLDTPLNTIIQRIVHHKSRRPIFEGLNEEAIQQKVESLYQARVPFYKKAIHTLSQENFTCYVQDIVSALDK